MKNPPNIEVKSEKIENFIAYEDGTALDTTTGLTWCRYSVGQIWQNGKVIGKEKQMDWDDAMEIADFLFNKYEFCGGFSDWRLPTDKELESIVKNESPFINGQVFFDISADNFWSTRVHPSDSRHAWIVYFNGYGSCYNFKERKCSVRLVRG